MPLIDLKSQAYHSVAGVSQNTGGFLQLELSGADLKVENQTGSEERVFLHL